MGRLLWKELREKRVWIPLVIASAIGVVVFADAATFCGPSDMSSPWTSLMMWFPLLFGASAYKGELGGAAGFLCSRPISWKRILIAKALVGLMVVAVAAALAAVAYRVSIPREYVKFATPDRLALGAVYAFLIMGASYLAGMALSLALPGGAGAILTLAIVGLAAGVKSLLFQAFDDHRPFWWSDYAWIVAVPVAGFLTARFGVTLPTRDRVVRYSVIVLLVVFCAIPLDLWAPPALSSIIFGPAGDYVVSDVSPDGRYALVEFVTPASGTSFWPGRSRYIVRVRDGRRARIALPEGFYETPRWTNSGTAYLYNGAGVIRTVRMDANGKAVERAIALRFKGNPSITPSPDRKLVLVEYRHPGRPEQHLEIMDIENARKLGSPANATAEYWWQSDTEVGYTDQRGRHIVRVVEEAR